MNDSITDRGLPPVLDVEEADTDLAAGTDQARTSGMSPADQLARLAPVSGAGQASASCEQKAHHFFAAPVRPPSPLCLLIVQLLFLEGLDLPHLLATELFQIFCSVKVSTNFSLASLADRRHRLTCSWYRSRSRQYVLSSVALRRSV